MLGPDSTPEFFPGYIWRQIRVLEFYVIQNYVIEAKYTKESHWPTSEDKPINEQITWLVLLDLIPSTMADSLTVSMLQVSHFVVQKLDKTGNINSITWFVGRYGVIASLDTSYHTSPIGSVW